MRVVHLHAENFKKLSVVEVSPSGDVIRVTGKNASGKSSLLDAIEVALFGSKAMPKKPLKTGAEEGMVSVTLGDFTITRKFSDGKKPTLMIESKEGARFPSPQTMLDQLMGDAGIISFDPHAFSRMKPAEQLAALRNIVKLDIDLAQIDVDNENDFNARAQINREIKKLEGFIAEQKSTRDFTNLPDEPVDEDVLLRRMSDASKHNTAAQRLIDEQRQQDRMAAGLQQQLEELQSRIAAYNELLKTRVKPPELEDVDTLRAEVEQARKTNGAILAKQFVEDKEAELAGLRKQSESYTAAINIRSDDRNDALAEVQMPVEGLQFGSDGILFNGEPFEQISTAEQLRVSCAIAMNTPSKVKVLRIADGSLLDEDGLKLVGDMATAAGWQVWIEMVGTGPVGIEMVDGSIVSIDGKAVPAKAPAVD